MAATVVIDAGHGGSDPGAVYNGRREKDDNLRLALAVGRILENNGVNVVYTRTGDVYDSPYEKAQIGNRSGADFFVSFHRNSSQVPGAYSGVETLVYNESGIKAELAERVNEELEKAGFKNLGLSVRPNLVVLNSTDMPSILIEAGFINSAEDNRIFDQNFDEIAAGIADAILDTVRADTEGTQYFVQTGLFRMIGNAQQQADQLWYYGYPADIDMYNNLYRVLVGPYTSMEEAADVERALRNMGYQTLIIQRG
ncbi:MAG: N-acetylmuramoyl-L-alanine amidase [Lachnospiraceae bacterium]|nr:N-acetylmuramoyl-L-alanine amidase [Lachnospiraceae bacterium]